MYTHMIVSVPDMLFLNLPAFFILLCHSLCCPSCVCHCQYLPSLLFWFFFPVSVLLNANPNHKTNLRRKEVHHSRSQHRCERNRELPSLANIPSHRSITYLEILIVLHIPRLLHHRTPNQNQHTHKQTRDSHHQEHHTALPAPNLERLRDEFHLALFAVKRLAVAHKAQAEEMQAVFMCGETMKP